MKRFVKGLVVVLAMVLGLVAAQGASAAEPFTVEGVISAVGTAPNLIEVEVNDGTEYFTIYNIPFNYLLNRFNIDLPVGQYVSVEVSEVECLDGSIKLIATTITVGDITVVINHDK